MYLFWVQDRVDVSGSNSLREVSFESPNMYGKVENNSCNKNLLKVHIHKLLRPPTYRIPGLNSSKVPGNYVIAADRLALSNNSG